MFTIILGISFFIMAAAVSIIRSKLSARQNLWLTLCACAAFASIFIIFTDPSWIWFGVLGIIIAGVVESFFRIHSERKYTAS